MKNLGRINFKNQNENNCYKNIDYLINLRQYISEYIRK